MSDPNIKSQTLSALTDGQDSPAVADKVKRELFAAQLGRCAAPHCTNKIHSNRTLLGECAHIIPKKVGSHPREDYKTPLADRNQLPNLMYLCETHHKFVDNTVLSADYTAEVLRRWKAEHEIWASKISKEPTYLPNGLQDELKAAISQIGRAGAYSNEFINKLFEACEEHVVCGRFLEAGVILSQVELVLSDFNAPKFVEKAKVLSAVLAYKDEKIHEAKEQLRSVIRENPEAHDAMFEYMEICEAAPENGDDAGRYEATLTVLYPTHPKLEILAAIRAGKIPDDATAHANKPLPLIDPPFLRLRLQILKATVFDAAQRKEQRNELLEATATSFPISPRPDLFRFIFRAADTLRGEHTQADLLGCLGFYEVQKAAADKKALPTLRDSLSWELYLFRVKLQLRHRFLNECGLEESAVKLCTLLNKCFADRYILALWDELLPLVSLPEDELSSLIEKLALSKVEKPEGLLEKVFVQLLPYPTAKPKMVEFLANEGRADLLEIASAIEDKNQSVLATSLSALNSDGLTLALLHGFEDQSFALQVCSNLKVQKEFEPYLQLFRANALAAGGDGKEALAIVASLDLAQLPLGVLGRASEIAYAQSHWSLFISIAKKLVESGMTDSAKAEIRAKLVLAYHREGDDGAAIKYALEVLAHPERIGSKNAEMILLVAADSYYRLGQPEKACEILEKSGLSPSFTLQLKKAEMLMRTQQTDKSEMAAQKIIEGFLLADDFDDRSFVSAFTLINETTKEIKNLDEARDGSFVKVEEVGWIYLGQPENAMGANPFFSGDNYNAVVGKKPGEIISWPPDRYSNPDRRRKLIYVLSPIAYLSARAHEGLERLARLGSESVWAVQVIKEDDSLNLDNLKNFLTEHDRPDFFELYCANPLPFAFLAAAERSITKAIGKICSEQRGFIWCNDGSVEDINRQSELANAVLNGAPYVIDGLAALLLAEAGILEHVIQSAPNLIIPLSVIKFLRSFAAQIDPTTSSVGRGGLVGGKFRFTDRSIERESELYKKLIRASELLDALPDKVIGHAPTGETEEEFFRATPECLLDPIHIGHERSAYLLTDDCFMPHTYGLLLKKPVPAHFSSIALIQCMHERSLIELADYLKYFSYLAGYRYRLLPIGVQDMFDAVVPKSNGGLTLVEPKNIEYFHLHFTLSKEYGVSETVALKVIAGFLFKVLTDDSVTEEVADSIFAYTIVRFFDTKVSKMQCSVLKEVCLRYVNHQLLLTQRSDRKLRILSQQLDRFSETFNPLFTASPSLMKIIRP